VCGELWAAGRPWGRPRTPALHAPARLLLILLPPACPPRPPLPPAAQALLPTPADPRLWVVQCRPGREREAVMQLLQKAYTLAEVRRPRGAPARGIGVRPAQAGPAAACPAHPRGWTAWSGAPDPHLPALCAPPLAPSPPRRAAARPLPTARHAAGDPVRGRARPPEGLLLCGGRQGEPRAWAKGGRVGALWGRRRRQRGAAPGSPTRMSSCGRQGWKAAGPGAGEVWQSDGGRSRTHHPLIVPLPPPPPPPTLPPGHRLHQGPAHHVLLKGREAGAHEGDA
jgi:hypothetical protein